MDPNQENENSEFTIDIPEDESLESVDSFLKELEAKERDLHITSDTTFIEIAAGFEDADDIPDFLIQDLKAEKPKMSVPVKPNGADPGKAERLESEVASLKKKIAEMKDERAELYEKTLRRSRDFEAYKTRTERERNDTFQRQLSNLATQMLPVLDNLDRALQFASEMPDEERASVRQFFDGITLVNQQVNEVLFGMGIVPIATVGEPFDPYFHEAVAVEQNTGFPSNVVCEEMLRGYRIGEKVIRHSMVKVAMSEQAVETPAAERPVVESPAAEPEFSAETAEIPEIERFETVEFDPPTLDETSLSGDISLDLE